MTTAFAHLPVHADETAVRALFQRLLDAWGRGDGSAYGALFTDDAGFDENAYVPPARFDTRPLADLIADLRAARAATLSLFRSFDADAWGRRGPATGKPVSVRALGYMIPGHERHHVEILRTRYGIGA